jgi:DNA-directed RNA polymerase specialized sigma24 family protein
MAGIRRDLRITSHRRKKTDRLSDFKVAVAMAQIFFTQPERELRTAEAQADHPAAWFSRCRETLHFTACMILGNTELADCAVEKCWLRVSRNPQCFESESLFQGWVLRMLISEAVSILYAEFTRDLEKQRLTAETFSSSE